MVIEDFYEVVDRAFRREARILSPFGLALKTAFELRLSAPESPQGSRWSERRLLPEGRVGWGVVFAERVVYHRSSFLLGGPLTACAVLISLESGPKTRVDF